jgi:hypothetical protein
MLLETCPLSLQAGHGPVEALEILEMGRGAILGLTIEDRSDIPTLRASYVEKADQFDELRIEINLPIHDAQDTNVQSCLVNQRISLVRELDNGVEKIRQFPGYERFLRRPTV